ncbi:radical SAM protein [Methanomethylophilus alvi]|uniref:radical SAM protein n=1 Tax=Methanomethylophilus alvi TaxID=1291540 RepID=UPI0037DC478C
MKGRPKVAVIDGYIDDPAALGVPPYISPMIRAVAGAARDAGADVEYVTVDMIRNGHPLPDADVSVVLSGNTVPGKYLRSMPMSLKELKELSPKLSGWKMIGGSSAFAPESQKFDFRIHRDLAASLYDGMVGKEVGERLRTLDEWNRWMLLGADIVKKHQDFPEPLMVEIESYRGCHRWASGGCSFCIEPSKGRPLMREPEDILAEAARLKDLGVRNIRVGGQTCIVSYGAEDLESGCPRPNPPKVRRLFEGLHGMGFDNLCVDNANPAVIARYPKEAEEVIGILADCCTSGNVLALGLESADPAVEEANNLNSTAESVMEAVRLINRVGGERGETGLPKILPGLNIICGLDGETSETYKMDLALLERIRDEGLLVRRINIRQVIGSRRPFDVKVSEKRFRKFKETVREEIDHPMLERLVPIGTVLRDVYAEIHDGNITFGRQPGSYPLLVGIPYKVDLDRSYDVYVTEWGFRSVTGVTYPFEINRMPMSSLASLPGIGKKRAAAIAAARPFGSLEDLGKVVEDPRVVEGLRGIVTFN